MTGQPKATPASSRKLATREVETAWIPLADGRRLAARLFLPADVDLNPVPAILEYIPYRRRDGTRLGDEAMHRWFAAQGYGCARVDIAGTGDSDGLLEDEYVSREQDDGIEVIAWLASQPWCSGAVGMIGISWGGFNSLQLAARRPPALRAIVTVCSTADRYRGDVHYIGGCLNEENLEWGAYLFAMHAMPPDPEVVGADRWRSMWRARIEAAILPPAQWLRHPHRDEFWRHGSVSEDWAAIDVPVLAVSGWADAYVDVVFDVLENVGARDAGPVRKAIAGPWGHRYPDQGVPGPAIGFLAEATRWWDRWLKGIDTGVERDPDLRAYVMDPSVPAAHQPRREGRWVAVPTWPPVAATAGPQAHRWALVDGALVERGQQGAGRWEVRSPQDLGTAGGQWCAYGLGKVAPDLPTDQREDDARSLCLDTEVLDASLDLLGRAQVRLRVASDRPVATVVARLCDVHPDGTSERISFGVANLTHRHGHDRPTPVVPGEAVDVVVAMKPAGHRLMPGHRLRLAISSTYWPMVWPSPQDATITVFESGSEVLVPMLTADPSTPAPSFSPPTSGPVGPVTVFDDGAEDRRVERRDGRTEVVVVRDDGRWSLDDIGIEQTYSRVRRSSIAPDDPNSAKVAIAIRQSWERGRWRPRIEVDVTMSSTADAYLLDATLHAFEGDDLVAERRFAETIDRDLA